VKKMVVILLVALALSVFGQAGRPDSAASPVAITGIAADSVHTDSLQNLNQTKKLPIIKRSINYAVAAKFAIGTMLFIAFLLTAGDAWNPGE
jgi:hypothetical protein